MTIDGCTDLREEFERKLFHGVIQSRVSDRAVFPNKVCTIRRVAQGASDGGPREWRQIRWYFRAPTSTSPFDHHCPKHSYDKRSLRPSILDLVHVFVAVPGGDVDFHHIPGHQAFRCRVEHRDRFLESIKESRCSPWFPQPLCSSSRFFSPTPQTSGLVPLSSVAPHDTPHIIMFPKAALTFLVVGVLSVNALTTRSPTPDPESEFSRSFSITSYHDLILVSSNSPSARGLDAQARSFIRAVVA